MPTVCLRVTTQNPPWSTPFWCLGQKNGSGPGVQIKPLNLLVFAFGTELQPQTDPAGCFFGYCLTSCVHGLKTFWEHHFSGKSDRKSHCFLGQPSPSDVPGRTFLFTQRPWDVGKTARALQVWTPRSAVCRGSWAWPASGWPPCWAAAPVGPREFAPIDGRGGQVPQRHGGWWGKGEIRVLYYSVPGSFRARQVKRNIGDQPQLYPWL